MTIDEPLAVLERPTSAPTLGEAAAWSHVGWDYWLGYQSQAPTAALLNGVLYVYCGDPQIGGGSAVMTSSDKGVTWSQQQGDFPARSGAAGAAFGTQLWLTGGEGFDDTRTSTDGLSWTLFDTGAGWGPRNDHKLIVFDGHLYLLGGFQNGQYMGDVWKLGDDNRWAQVCAQAFTPCARPTVGVIAGLLVVMTGATHSGEFPQFFTSPDGVTWTPHTAPWPPRLYACAATVGHTLCLMGGLNPEAADVWGTTDGLQWTRLDQAPPWPGFFMNAAVAVDDRLLVVGGLVNVQEPMPNPDVYAYTPPKAPPGRWSLADSEPNIALQKQWPILAGGPNLLFAYGGDSGTSVLRSNDGGASWTPLTADYTPRAYPAGTTHGGLLWMVGGEGRSDTLMSNYGDHWTPRAGEGGWGPRSGHSVVSLGETLYLLAGIYDQRPKGDVWTLSSTWSEWSLLKADAFTPRLMCASAALGGNIVLMGGNCDAGPLAEVLLSSDGQTWESRIPPWSGRWGAVATVLGDTLYLIGGKDAADTVLKEVWTTRDAVTWTRIADLPVALDQLGAGAVGDHVVVLGGQVAGQPSPNVWAYNPSDGWIEIGQYQDAGLLNYAAMARLGSTTYALDGSNLTRVVKSDYERIWTSVDDNNLPFRQKAAAAAHGGKLWVTGGDIAPGHATQDVFYSTDGVAWTAGPRPMWSPRRKHAIVDFEGVLYLIGGDSDIDGICSDVYWLDDATYRWGQERANPFPGRCAAAAVAFNGNIWLLGGRNAAGPIAEALRRNPDYTWTTFPVPWAARHSLAAGVLDGKLYVALGQGAGGPLTDAWVSADGRTWDPVDRPPGPALRDNAGFLAHDDALLAVGGTAADGQPNFAVRRFLPPPD